MASTAPSHRRPSRAAAVLVVCALGAGGWWIWRQGEVGPITVRSYCETNVGGAGVDLDPEQAGNAGTIAAVAMRRGLPARAVTIALATAMQESKLRNLAHGDRDSLGLFQQRPSQGWGTAAQVRDPVYASNAFYTALVKIRGYETMPITEAAQAVQRSAYPAAYAQHEPEARALASSLTGHSPAGLTCSLGAPDVEAQRPDSAGLIPRARAVLTATRAEIGGGGGAQPGSNEGTVLKLHPRSGPAAETQRRAWGLASWAVARASGLDIVEVQVGGRRWTRKDGWADEPRAPRGETVLVRVAN